MNYASRNRFMSRLITQLLACSAMLLIYHAHLYLTVGYGVNPFLGLPLATLFLIEPYLRNQYLNIR
jgi:hypothetical protein